MNAPMCPNCCITPEPSKWCPCPVGHSSRTVAPSSRVRFDANAIIDRGSNPLLAAKVSFGRLNRDVPQKELDLLQLASRSNGRAEHRSAADRAAPTWPLRCSWRIPSRCAKPPLPSRHLPMPSFTVTPSPHAFPTLLTRRNNYC